MTHPPDDSPRSRFRRLNRLFDGALDLSEGERSAYLKRECGDEGDLRREVERLLDSHDRSDALFGRSASALADPIIAAATPQRNLTPAPARIGPYRVEREIGRGGMGIVYLAERDDPQFPQRVALKVVRDGAATSSSTVSRFLAERQLLVALEHPHIARLFDGGVTTDGLPYYTMAYCEGGSLAERLAANGALPIDEAVLIARQLASALAAAHARSIVHRDVKPQNVLFDVNGAARLSDFGVAKLLDDDVTRSGIVLGTAAYLSPEQVTGQPVDHRADLWALGVTLYEMLARRRPFAGSTTAAVLYEIAYAEPTPLRRLVPDVPSHVERVVANLLQKDPAARPQTAEEVTRALEDASASSSTRPRTATLFAAAIIALLLLGSLAVWQLRDSAPDPPIAETIAVPSVAIIPFVNTSGDPADEPFADGLTDELIGALGKVPGLRVIARSSVFALKGSGLDARSIADTLGVDHLVEGSVRRSGNRLRVIAQLVSATDGAQRWSETYDRDLRDVFTVQQEMARAMATSLQGRLSGEGETSAVATRPTEDALAYDLYLKGRFALNTRTQEQDLRRAVGFFEEAIARDSSYAQAWSGLSDASTAIANFGYGRPQEWFGKGRDAAVRALALDSTLAEARASLGHVLFVHYHDWKASERELRRAILEDPGYTHARVLYSVRLMSEARYAESIAQLDTARAADPLRPAIDALLGRAYVGARMPDEAIRALRRAIDLNPQADLAWQQLGHAYLLKGMAVEAIAALRRAAELSGMRDSAQLAYAYAVTGQRQEAERIVRDLVASSETRYVVPFHIAMAYAGLGDADETLRWLERSYEERGSFLNGVAVTPAFDFVREDPRFADLLQRMGLDPAMPVQAPRKPI